MQEQMGAEPQNANAPVNRPTLLIVDDNTVNRRVLCRILQDRYDTLQAENGQQALEILQEQEDRIALVLLDIVMPVMNGYDFLNAIKDDPILSAIPVVMTTSSTDEQNEIKCLSCGASDYLTKPYNVELVRHRVASILRLREKSAIVNMLEYDRLTGLYSKEFFYMHARTMLEHHPDQDFDLLCGDIDHFKIINERYGTQLGDEVLRFTAEQFRHYADKDGICGRISSDAFAILSRRRPAPDREEFARCIQQDFQSAPVKNIVLKFGCYRIDDPSMEISAMCGRALLALKSVKHQYGVAYAIYDDSTRLGLLKEQQILDNMEQALRERQFQVYYQPKHDVATGAVAGAEALVRWIHPTLGFQSPGEFIPVFERNGFISQLDQYMWEQVCIYLRKRDKHNQPPIPISVNVSRMDFTPSLPQYLTSLTNRYQVPPKLLHLEVTETAYTDDPEQIISIVDELRSIGFLIEMDDFGSGYSSLNMLSELPIDLLKLDMRFMKKDGEGANKKSILSFIISLSKWLNLPTVAEGVESADEVEILRSMGCNYIQGYYYAKPMPEEEFTRYLADVAQRLSQTSAPAVQQQPAPLPRQEVRHTILIAEGVKIHRNTLYAMLHPYYHLVMMETSQQALDYLRANPGTVSLVLLDLMLSVMDGFTFLKELHQNPATADIPVIVTSEADDSNELRAIQLGADDYVSKTCPLEVLLHHIRRAIDYTRTLRTVPSGFGKDDSQSAMVQAQWKLLSALPDLSFAVYETDTHCLYALNSMQDTQAPSLLMENYPESIISAGFVRQEDVDGLRGLFRDLEAGQETGSIGLWRKYPGTDGYFCIRLIYQALPNPNGKPRRALLAIFNYTEQKKAEYRHTRELKALQSDQNERNLLAKGHANLSRNQCLEFEAYNDKITNSYADLSFDRAVQRIAEQAILPREQENILGTLDRIRLMDACMQGQNQFTCEYMRRSPDNIGMQWISVHLSTMRMPGSEEIESFTYCYDITDQKLNETILQRLLWLTFDCLAVINTQSRKYRLVERAAHPGLSEAAFEIRDDFDTYLEKRSQGHFDHRRFTVEAVQRILAKRDVWEAVVDMPDQRGELRHRMLQFLYMDESKEQLLFIMTDVTASYSRELKQKEQLALALQAAEQANQAKTDFLARMSHDIRTPLNAIIGMTALAQAEATSPAIKEYLSTISSSSHFLLSIISDVLDMAKIENGSVTLHPMPYLLDDFETHLNALVRPLCEQKGVHFSFTVQQPAVPCLLLDPLRFEQVIFNLVSNAVKFTPVGGHVQVSVDYPQRWAEQVQLRIQVRDDGRGMSKAFQKQLFEPFTQEDPLSQGDQVGTGLGLAITRNLLDLMGGTITVESELGKGSLFTVELPVRITDESLLRPQAPSDTVCSLAGKHILLCEDQPLNARIAASLLRRKNMQVTFAQNGQEGLRLFSGSPPGTFDAVLMDIRMPEMDGLTATRAIRALERPDAARIPIIAMTANAFPDDVAASLEAGMNAHLAKPIDPQTLYHTLAQFIKKEDSTDEDGK